jgi:hypothetical protein
MLGFRKWLENSEADAEKYFSIGHGDYSDEYGEPSYIVWVLLNDEIKTSNEIKDDSSSATHGSLWGHQKCNNTFKGRFEPETGRISIVKPFNFHNEDWYVKYELIPKLEKMFGKLKRNNIFIF